MNECDEDIYILQYVDTMQKMNIQTQLKALNNSTGLKTLEWLKDPENNFHEDLHRSIT